LDNQKDTIQFGRPAPRGFRIPWTVALSIETYVPHMYVCIVSVKLIHCQTHTTCFWGRCADRRGNIIPSYIVIYRQTAGKLTRIGARSFGGRHVADLALIIRTRRSRCSVVASL